MDQPAPFFEEDYLSERSLDVEVVDPAIYSDMLGIQDDILSFSPIEEASDTPTGRCDFPPQQCENSLEFIQLEAPIRSNYMYPSPINYFAGWGPLEEQVHTHPGYGDYVTSLDEADIRCPPPAPPPTSASTFSDNDTVTQQTTPSPSFFTRSCEKVSLSSSTPQNRLSPARGLTLRELSPTPGARGHETFVEAASAILDLPISWRGNGTLREFLDEEDEEYYVSDEEEEEEIDYTIPQYTKMRQPDFHRNDCPAFPDLGGPKISLDDASTSDNPNLGATQEPTTDGTATDTTKMTPAAATKEAKVNVKIVGPFSLASTEAEPLNH